MHRKKNPGVPPLELEIARLYHAVPLPGGLVRARLEFLGFKSEPTPPDHVTADANLIFHMLLAAKCLQRA